jgi:hypothetical protein
MAHLSNFDVVDYMRRLMELDQSDARGSQAEIG